MSLRTLLAWLRGEPRVCSIVPIPDEATEDGRRPMREREELVRMCVGIVNRIGAVLTVLGASEYSPLRRDCRERLGQLRTGLDQPLPPHARAQIERLLDRLDLVRKQVAELDAARDLAIEGDAGGHAEKIIHQLARPRANCFDTARPKAVRGAPRMNTLRRNHDSIDVQAPSGRDCGAVRRPGTTARSTESEMEKLHAKIGQLLVERNLWPKASGRWSARNQARGRRVRLHRTLLQSATPPFDDWRASGMPP
jgi:hypothetical protein